VTENICNQLQIETTNARNFLRSSEFLEKLTMTDRMLFRSFYFLVGFLAIRLLGASWIDPDTPYASRTTKALFLEDTRKYELVFSDEFEQAGRNFKDGSDPRWTALQKNDCEYW
jgi:hypothetical protein